MGRADGGRPAVADGACLLETGASGISRKVRSGALRVSGLEPAGGLPVPRRDESTNLCNPRRRYEERYGSRGVGTERQVTECRVPMDGIGSEDREPRSCVGRSVGPSAPSNPCLRRNAEPSSGARWTTLGTGVGLRVRAAEPGGSGRADGERLWGSEGKRKIPVCRCPNYRVTLLLVLVALSSLLAVSCSTAPSGVEGHWTGPLRLSDRMAYDVELDLEQDGERLSGSGHMAAAVAGESDAPVEVIEGSRVDGEEITLVLRDTVYGVLTVRLNGTVEDGRIEAEGSYRGGGFDLRARTDLEKSEA